MSYSKRSPRLRRDKIRGTHAILGMDMVSFSTLSDDDQLRAIEALIHWVKSALAFHGLTEKDYCWSPAGDGGYITFDDKEACSKAIDVAFSIFEKLPPIYFVNKCFICCFFCKTFNTNIKI